MRSVLPSIQAPTLILHRAENRHYRVPMGRYLAEHIPGAKYVELPGADWYPPFVNAEPVLDEIEEFLTGAPPSPAQDRILATVLFTDIVGSTDLATRLGDQHWLDLRAAHDGLVRTNLARYRGKEVATTGDGFLATFDGPARAVRCASEIASAVRSLGIEIRAGCTAARSRSRTDRSQGSRSTSPRASWHLQVRAGCWCRARSRISWSVRPSGSPTAGLTSEASLASGACSRSPGSPRSRLAHRACQRV